MNRWFLYACGFPKDSLYFFANGICMTIVFFIVRILSIPMFWYKIFSVLDSNQWLKLKLLRHALVITCISLDVINVYWFRKMLRGAIIVWSTNWNYYEKHYKNEQLKMLFSYQRSIKRKTILAVSSIGTFVNKPGSYLGSQLLERIIVSLQDVRDSFLSEKEEDNLAESDSEHDPSDMELYPYKIINFLPKPFKYRS